MLRGPPQGAGVQSRSRQAVQQRRRQRPRSRRRRRSSAGGAATNLLCCLKPGSWLGERERHARGAQGQGRGGAANRACARVLAWRDEETLCLALASRGQGARRPRAAGQRRGGAAALRRQQGAAERLPETRRRADAAGAGAARRGATRRSAARGNAVFARERAKLALGRRRRRRGLERASPRRRRRGASGRASLAGQQSRAPRRAAAIRLAGGRGCRRTRARERG
jgi:hypothetical protein